MTPQWAQDKHIFDKWFISYVFTEKPQNIGIYNLPFFKSRWKLVNSSQTFERNWLLFSLKVWASNPRRWISEENFTLRISSRNFRLATSMLEMELKDAAKILILSPTFLNCHQHDVTNINVAISTWSDQGGLRSGWSLKWTVVVKNGRWIHKWIYFPQWVCCIKLHISYILI